MVGWHDRQIGLAVKDVLQITTAWWTDGPDFDGMTEWEAGEPGSLADQEDPEADQQLQEIELEALLAPLFGGSDGDDDATETERQ